MIFQDRVDAGRQLAEHVKDFAGRKDVLLFALPRGGVVLGAEIAKTLGLPLSVIVTRKIGSPENPEYAIGALSETGQLIWNESERFAHDQGDLNRIVEKEKNEAKRRVEKFRKGAPLPDMRGKTVMIIDDGVATGLTIRAAIACAKFKHAAKIVLALPNGAHDSIKKLRNEVDEIRILEEPVFYEAVGHYYTEFKQTEDQEVVRLLESANA